MKFKIGEKVKVINNTCCHPFSMQDEYYIHSIAIKLGDIAYLLNSDVGFERLHGYVRECDIKLVEPKHICKLICDCDHREAVKF